MNKQFNFWGTVMVAICFVTGVMVFGGGRYSFAVFMKPLSESMEWSRSQLSLAVTLNLIFYGMASPVIGWLFDTIGARKVMITGAALMTFSLCAMYFANNLWMFYVLYGVLSAFGANAIGRMSQVSIVTNWFVKRRGMMMGVTALSIGLGTAIMAPAVRLLLDTYGWRLAFAALGVMMGLLVLLPIVLFVKGQGRPEDRGFGPDGAPLSEKHDSAPGNTGAARMATSDDWKVSEALRTPAFWAVSLAMGITYMGSYVFLLHGPADFEGRGFSGTTAAMVLSIGTLASCIGRLGFGWLADHAPLKTGFLIQIALHLVALPWVLLDGGVYMLYTFAVIWGIGYGGTGVYLPYSIAYYFGRTSFGSIYGWSSLVSTFCGATGGYLGGLIYDLQGSYHIAWIGCALLWSLALILIALLANKPARREAVVLAG
ncbi:MAG: MFS transporter [Porticoccaceae bacterium]